MSATWMLVRGASANPSSLKFAALMNKQSIAENEVFKPERQRPAIISTHMEDSVLLHDPFFFKKLRTMTHKYYAPWEPDGVLLKYWCKFNHIAKKLKDHSFSENYTFVHGKPKLCLGPDDGTKGGTIVIKLNENNNLESPDYFSTPDNSSIRVSTATNGFSIYLEFIVDGMGSVDQNFDPTLQYKFDDSNNRRCIRFSPDTGRLHFHVREGGVDTNFYTPDNTITPKSHYKCWFRYNPTTNIATVTVNNIAQTDVADGNPSAGDSTTELLHGKRGSINGGYPFVRFIDSRWYNFIVSDDHIKNIWNNGRSICAANVITFDGVNDYIDCGNDSSLWSQNLTKFSFSCWIYPTSGWDTFNREIVEKSGSAAHGFRLEIDDSTVGQIKAHVKDSLNVTKQSLNNNLILNKWNFLTFVYDKDLANANVKAYVNAIPPSVTGDLTETINQSAILTLGQSGNALKGDMKDFRWWTTIALTEAQIIAVRDNLSTAPLPNYWLKMNEGNSNPIDYITRTKVGTLTNGATWAIGSSPRPAQYGSLAVAGYTRFNDIVDAGGFDSTGYDSTGFDTT